MNEMKEKWQGTPKFIRIICYTVLGTAAAVLFGFVFGLAIKLLWNWLMPELFNLKEITYWQAIGIFLLTKIVFGSFGGGSSEHKSGKSSKKDKLHGCVYDYKDNKESLKSWEYYEKWWEEEGKKSYDDFVDLRNNGKGDINI